MNREREGLLLCLLSAAGFAAMPIFARQAYATGIELTPLLALRFVMAAAMLWALVLLRRRPLGSPRGLALGAALGFGGYALQAGLYFGAVQRIDVGLASLLLYAYPSFVTLAAFALRRESPTRRKLGALALAPGAAPPPQPGRPRARLERRHPRAGRRRHRLDRSARRRDGARLRRL